MCSTAGSPTYTGFFITSPSGSGNGAVAVAPGTNICSASQTGNQKIVNLYIGVTVPMGKNSGVYASTLTLGLQ